MKYKQADMLGLTDQPDYDAPIVPDLANIRPPLRVDIGESLSDSYQTKEQQRDFLADWLKLETFLLIKKISFIWKNYL